MTNAVLHIAIAVTWLFLSPVRDLPRLMIGFLIGYALLLLFRPLLPRDTYIRRLAAFIKWVVLFLKALVQSQLRVSRIVLFPRANPIHPGFVDYPLEDLSDVEIMILSHSITLTPGTASVEVNKEERILLIHALEAEDPEETIREIREDLLKPMLAFTRP